MKKILFLIILSFSIQLGFTQNPTIDSLLTVLKTAKHDTIKVATYLAIAEQIYMQQPDSAVALWKKGVLLAEKNLKNHYASKPISLVFKKQIAESLGNIGYILNNKGDISNALNYYKKSLKLFEDLGDKKGLASALNNIGFVYHSQGEIPNALKLYIKSLKISEEIEDMSSVANSLNNIAGIYMEQDDLSKAFEYFDKSLKIHEKNGNKIGIAFSLSNLGIVYQYKRDFANALSFHNKSLKLREEIGDKNQIATSLNNIGHIYHLEGKLSKAILYYEKSYSILKEIKNIYGQSASLINIGNIYAQQKEFNKAIEYCKKSMELGKQLGFPENIKGAAIQLAQIYREKGDYKNSLENYILYIEMRDSTNNIETQKASIKQQTKYEYDKQKAVADKEHEQQMLREQEKAATEKTKKNIIITSISIILFLLFLFSVFLYNRFRLIRKQKNIIELKERETHAQKEIIEEKHKEITDSINYAERIQRSFLATTEMLDKYLSSPWGGAEGGGGLPVPVIAGEERTKQSAASEEIASLTTFTRNDENTVTSISPKNEGISRSKRSYFVFFRPKDVVSGDFYWAGELNNGNFAFSVADSTGHGVPGAIMSILNISSLEKSIEKETEPHNILNQTRRIIIDRLKKDGSKEGGKDGMDCSLFVINKDKTQLSFSMANNPVFIVRLTVIASEERTKQSASSEEIASLPTVARNDGNFELFEYKPDKMPVGKHDKENEPFTLHTLQLQKGDIIYALTDGFPDQFGGEKSKKYMIKNLKNLLLQIAHLPMHEQEQKLAEEFTAWKGSNEQVDDVCVIGVRV
jgi:tetratricopeptide (TPR) repeat protein